MTDEPRHVAVRSAPPVVVVSNDDGILSPGLAALAEAVMDLGELLIVAPASQQSGMGHSRPRFPTTGRIAETKLELRGTPVTAFAVDGSPAQCVAHAVLELTDRLPALCVSGINYGENLGHSLTVSGTVGAALEASAFGIPGIAVSRQLDPGVDAHSSAYPAMDWTVVAHCVRRLAVQVLRDGLPGDIVALNLNVPDDATIDTPMRSTIQSRQPYYVHQRPAARDLSLPHLVEMNVEIDLETLEPDSDLQAFAIDRIVSVTPLSGSLTARATWSER